MQTYMTYVGLSVYERSVVDLVQMPRIDDLPVGKTPWPNPGQNLVEAQ